MKKWNVLKDVDPEIGGYYSVKYANGKEDQKYYRVSRKEFLTLEEVIYWK